MPGPDEANIARIVALRVGCGERVPAFTVQRNCASGMQALDTAARNIGSGRADLILAGGIEAMSHAPVLLGTAMVAWLAHWSRAKGAVARAKALAQLRPAHLTPVIGLLRGLTDPVVGLSMGQTAEILAHRFNISREQMDAFAMSSHQRLAAAQDQKHLDGVEVVYDRAGKCYTADDGLRRETDMTSLGKLKPVFDKPFGKVTAGNSAQVTDGAACLILACEDAVQKSQVAGAGAISGQRMGRTRSGADGPGSGICDGAAADAPWLRYRRHRLLGDQRGLRGTGAGLHGGLERCRLLPRLNCNRDDAVFSP